MEKELTQKCQFLRCLIRARAGGLNLNKTLSHSNGKFDFDHGPKCKEENKRLHDIIDDSIIDLYDGLKRVNNRVDEVELEGTIKSTYKV